MRLGTVSVRPTPTEKGLGGWTKATIVQAWFIPTYLEVLEGTPSEEQLKRRLKRRAESIWGERENLKFFMGKGIPDKRTAHLDLSPEDQTAHGAGPRFAPLSVFVEFEGPLFEPSDPKDMDTASNAYVVFLSRDLNGNIERLVQRLVDSYEMIWDQVAINTSP